MKKSKSPCASAMSRHLSRSSGATFTWAVESTGLRAPANGTRSRIARCAPGGSSGSVRPTVAATSASSTPTPPDSVIDAEAPARRALAREAPLRRVIGDVGDLEQRLERFDAERSLLAEHRVEHRVVARKHAGVRRGGRLAHVGRADLQDEDRFPAARASPSAARKRSAWPHASRQHAITRVSESRAIHAITSPISTSASFPVGDPSRQADAGVPREDQQVRAHCAALHRHADPARGRRAAFQRQRERPVAAIAERSSRRCSSGRAGAKGCRRHAAASCACSARPCPRLGKPRAEDDRRFGADRRRLRDDFRCLLRGERDDDQLRRRGQAPSEAKAGMPCTSEYCGLIG